MLADRNLLFGVLALQNDFVTRDQLVEAMNAWAIAKQRSVGDILRERGALGEKQHALLEALVQFQLDKHGGDAEKSMHALAPSSGVREALASASGSSWSPETTCTPFPAPTTPGGPRYRVLRPHARGGLGEVFVAEDTELHREVALKQIQDDRADDPASRNRFLLEGEITGRLEHPGIVPVYGLGTYEDGRPFYAMRFLRGDNLKHAIDKFHASKLGFDTVEFKQVLRRFLDVCNAVAFAHSRGVLHRDIKPGNVMLGEFGETLLVDWGLAKVVGRAEPGSESEARTLRPSSGSAADSVAGVAVGTASYMSPEQAEGKLDALGPTTDVYSLGATLYCLLTGRPPVPNGPAAEMLEKVRRGDVPPASRWRPDAPRPLDAVRLRAMSPRPEDRYPSPGDMAREIERWLADEPISAFRDPLSTRFRRWARKRRTLVATSSAVLLVSVVALAVGLAVVSGLNASLASANTALTESYDKLDRSLAETAKERDTAQAVNEFLHRDLLAQADIANQADLRGEAGRDANVTVAELLRRAAMAVERKFKGRPETEAAIRLTIGDAFRGLGEFDLARVHLERAVAIRESVLGPDHPDTLHTRNSLAGLYEDMGKYDECERVYQDIYRRRERILGADHPLTMNIKNNLAILYKVKGDLARAEPMLRECLAARGADDDPVGTATTKSNLGVVYYKKGEYAKAEPLFVEALAVTERERGPDHPSTLTSMSLLASLYEAQGRYDKGVPLLKKVAALREKKLGDDHPSTLTSKNNLGLALQEQSKLAEAEAIFVDVLARRVRKLGIDHPDTLTSKNNLARLFHEEEKYELAEPLYLEVIQGRTAKLGADHPATLLARNNLAAMYRIRGQIAQAEKQFLEIITAQTNKLGADHPNTLTTKNNLALLYKSRQMYDKAEPLYLEVLSLREKKLGADHPSTLSAKFNLATMYRDKKEFAKGEALYLEVIRESEAKQGADFVDTMNAKSSLAMLYIMSARPDKAEPLFLDIATRQEKKLGPNHNDTLVAKMGLAMVYKARREYDKAEPFLVQVLAAVEKKHGPTHESTLSGIRNLADLYDLGGKYDKAESLWRRRLAAMEPSASALALAGAKLDLATTLLSLKKYGEAETLLREALATREKAKPDDVATVGTRSLLGEALAGQKKFAEAEPLLLQSYEALKKLTAKLPPPARAARLRGTLRRLVALNEAMQKKDEAAKYQKELDALAKK